MSQLSSFKNVFINKIENKIVKSTTGQPMATLEGAYSTDWNSARKPRGNVRVFPGSSGLVGEGNVVGRSS